jgi:hypothetical protein
LSSRILFRVVMTSFLFALLGGCSAFDKQILTSESPDKRVRITFWHHPDPFGGVIRVTVNRDGKTSGLYVIDNDSCPAPNWSDGKERLTRLSVDTYGAPSESNAKLSHENPFVLACEMASHSK